MATKLIVGSPQNRRRNFGGLLGDVWTDVVEAPYFTIPFEAEGDEVVDPDDADRSLREGEIFLVSKVRITNTHTETVTVDAQVVLEDGTVIAVLRNSPVISDSSTLFDFGGNSLFKTDLVNPGNAGDKLQMRCSVDAVAAVFFTYIERGALQHGTNVE